MTLVSVPAFSLNIARLGNLELAVNWTGMFYNLSTKVTHHCKYLSCRFHTRAAERVSGKPAA